MDGQETQETAPRETRGRAARATTVMLHQLPVADLKLAIRLMEKRVGQTGEHVPLERIFSEALQHYGKALSGQEA